MSDSIPALIGQVIAIGDELTSGGRLDTNTQWLSQQLTDLGIRVMFHATIADDLNANVVVFRDAIERADVVVCTGGLGPTADDLTREAIAATLGVSLQQDDKVLEHIRTMFQTRGRTMPERNALQALFPQGSQQIFNAHGTAPGIQMRIERSGRLPCLLFALPGVPAEMFPMWKESVAPAIAAARPALRVTRQRRIKCFGAGESHIEEMLGDMIHRGRDPLVGITASSATITLRISASGSDEAECLARMEPTVAEIYETLGELVYGEEDEELGDALMALLRDHNKTIGVIEGATRGQVERLLTTADAKCHNFRGATIMQATPDDASGQAMALAKTARRQFGSDLGLAISDWSPSNGDGTSLVTIALADAKGGQAKSIPLHGDPQLAQLRVARGALNFVRLSLLRHE